MTLSQTTLVAGALQMRVVGDGSRIEWRDIRRDARLIEAEEGAWMAPVLDGRPPAAGAAAVEAVSASVLRIRRDTDGVRDFRIELAVVPGEDAFDLSCEFTAGRDCQLNALDILPAGALLNLYEVINFLNRHHTPRVWPELLLGGAGCETDTYSGDWQFTPHPTMLLFNKLHSKLFLGAFDLTTAYGLHFKARDYHVEHCRLNYGEAPWGLPLKAGETFRSPRFRLFLRHGLTEWEMFETFGAMLVRGGIIPDPTAKAREAWWTEPLYCTWIDQCFKSAYLPPAELQEQAAQCDAPTRKMFTEALVREAVEVIRREKLPFRTILLDEGWHVARGQWEAHPARFPDLRGLVDELHAAGFKVVVWWNWAEIEKTADVDAAHLLAGGKLHKHGCRMRDYSLQSTQEEYLKPLFHRLFSADAGCYDLDGVKTDFLADKVHPDLPPADPAWRGEENYFLKVTELFYREMKRWKPDAVHIGCAGNYHLAHLIDINRTYDVHSANWREHEERAKMLRHTAPGCPVAYDFHNFLLTPDGLFVATLFKAFGPLWGTFPSLPRGALLNDLTCHGENFWPTINQTADGKVYLVTGQTHCSIVRVDGLDSLRRLPEQPLPVTAGMLSACADYVAQSELRRQQAAGRDTLHVAIREQAPVVDGKLDDWGDARWVLVGSIVRGVNQPLPVQAAAAVTGERLYVALKTPDDSLLVNKGDAWQMLFKTGGGLDVMLNTEAHGDQRLLVALVNKKPLAVRYRPKAAESAAKVPFSSPWRTVTFDEVLDVSAGVELTGTGGNYELSVPLATLGLKPTPGLRLKGDIGILRGIGGVTAQRLYWQNKATGLVSDVPGEAELAPKLWGWWEFSK